MNPMNPDLEKLDLSDFANYLKPRPKEWHKGLSGHVLIIGGEVGFAGAPLMAAEAALRVGAGLVSIATRNSHIGQMNARLPEVMCHGVDRSETLDPLIEKAKVVVIGPGIGQSAWAKDLLNYIIKQSLPLVVDADGLNILSQSTPQNNPDWILTPHVGEASRLLKQTASEIQNNRFSAVLAIQQRFGGVCVLKGAGSLVMGPDHSASICEHGNPGMATGGMGDVLSGVIGGLLAQSIPLLDAAKAGVLIHALAGDLAAKQGERGMIATDLMPYLRRLVNG